MLYRIDSEQIQTHFHNDLLTFLFTDDMRVQKEINEIAELRI
jgi:hypothetical protein